MVVVVVDVFLTVVDEPPAVVGESLVADVVGIMAQVGRSLPLIGLPVRQSSFRITAW